MDKFHPFQIILIVVFAFLALFGIFSFASFNGGVSSSGNAGEVLIWGTLPQEAIQTGIDEIRAGSDKYSDVSYEEHPAETFDRDLADAIAAGGGPDMIILSQEDLFANRAKLTLLPPSVISERTYIDSYLSIFELFLTDGGVYGVPLAVDPMVLFYNRQILASAGAATPPATWEAVTGLAKPIVRRTPDGSISEAVIPFGEYTNVRNARGIISLLFLQAGSPITIQEKEEVKSVLTDTAGAFGQTAAQSALNFYTQFADPAKAVYSWNRSLPDSRSLFIAGDLALYPGFSSELPYLLAANPNLDIDVAPIPQPGTATVRTTYGLAYAFAVPKASKNPNGALQTAYALTAEMPMTAITSELSMVPARRSLVGKGSDDRYAAVSYADALVAKGWLSPGPAATDVVFSAMIGNITSGRMDSLEALHNAGESLNETLR
ncbi:MAG TPA: extracellular solute-binding protein [Candidatus Paceibacterota bacterium]|nr:extracellular solute-binding protein [Candidatus Paceibacterota bacterium]